MCRETDEQTVGPREKGWLLKKKIWIYVRNFI